MVDLVFFVLLFAAFMSIPYAWVLWPAELRKAELPMWRRRCVIAGLLAVTIQGAILIAFFTPLLQGDARVMRWTIREFFVFLIAVPCLLTGKGRLRWVLPSASLLLMIGSFGVSLSP